MPCLLHVLHKWFAKALVKIFVVLFLLITLSAINFPNCMCDCGKMKTKLLQMLNNFSRKEIGNRYNQSVKMMLVDQNLPFE